MAATAALAGCIVLVACSNRHSDLEEATGEGSIRALHAVPELGAVRFLVKETLLASVDYKDVSATSSYDNLTHAFNFDVLLPGDSDYMRIATRELKVADESEYTFVLTGTLAAPEIVLWEQFGRDWDALLDEADENDTEVTILDVSFGHTAQTVADVDLYLNITPADYAGMFLAEEQIDLASGARYGLYLNGLPGQLSAVLLRDQTRRLALYARLRLYQAASRFGSLDAYLVAAGSDIALLSPYLSSLAYTGSTSYASIVPGTYEVYFTMPGTKTIVAGPLHADLEAGNLYDVVAVDTAQTDVADVLYFQE